MSETKQERTTEERLQQIIEKSIEELEITIKIAEEEKIKYALRLAEQFSCQGDNREKLLEEYCLQYKEEKVRIAALESAVHTIKVNLKYG